MNEATPIDTNGNRRVFAQALRRAAARFESGEELDPVQEIEKLEELLIGLELVGTHEIDPDAHINGVELDSLVDAVHALSEAGVVRFDVHPLFWAKWEGALKRHAVPRGMTGPSFALHVKVEDRPPIRSVVTPFESCGRPNCPTCDYLHWQWATTEKPEPQLDPRLN